MQERFNEFREYDDEIFKPVRGFKNQYFISNYEKVVSLKGKSPKLKAIITNRNGYSTTTLCLYGKTKTKMIHRLLYETFIGPIKEGYSIDHIDGNKNNNSLSNLRQVTTFENTNSFRRKPKNNTSNYYGVSKSKNSKKWTCQLQSGYNSSNLGTFYSKTAAAVRFNEQVDSLKLEYKCKNIIPKKYEGQSSCEIEYEFIKNNKAPSYLQLFIAQNNYTPKSEATA